jgi:hypothetical protein
MEIKANSVNNLAKFKLKTTRCSADWNALSGDDRIRWSSKCQHLVYDVRLLSTDQFEKLVWFREGACPNTLYRRADGKILTKSCTSDRPLFLGNRTPLLACLVIVVLGTGHQITAKSPAVRDSYVSALTVLPEYPAVANVSSHPCQSILQCAHGPSQKQLLPMEPTQNNRPGAISSSTATHQLSAFTDQDFADGRTEERITLPEWDPDK